MRNRNNTTLVLLCVVASVWSSCDSGRPLDARRVLGSSLQEASERWGEPVQYTEDPMHERGHGFASWQDVSGAKITAFSRMGKIVWLTYRFQKMEPFDEAQAFSLINVDPDPDQAHHLKTPGAKRWSPFEQYQKLTVSSVTKMVAVGDDPMSRVQPVEISEVTQSVHGGDEAGRTE
jgi:hypothetical protein